MQPFNIADLVTSKVEFLDDSAVGQPWKRHKHRNRTNDAQSTNNDHI